MPRMKSLFCWLSIVLMLISVAACGGDGSSNIDDVNDGPTVANVPDYGGSIPRGDYVTANIDGATLNVTNHTVDEEVSLEFEAFTGLGSSILYKTEPDQEGSYYYFAQLDDVLGILPMGDDDRPNGELPLYMFDKEELSVDSLKGKAYNFMEVNAADEGFLVEIGIVGFDIDAEGRLYGAAFDSDGYAYSITDEDDEPDSGDEFKLTMTSQVSDGSLILWEDGEDNWSAATTLTGTGSGPVVLDHGPAAGGGAGFALPQVTENDPDVFWDTVAGNYFTIVTSTDGIEAVRCVTKQSKPGSWEGVLEVQNYNPESGSYEVLHSFNIISLSLQSRSDIESLAGFDNADSEVVQMADEGKGVFQEDTDAPNLIVAFDPEGNYLGVVNLLPGDALFAVGVRDRNWGN